MKKILVIMQAAMLILPLTAAAQSGNQNVKFENFGDNWFTASWTDFISGKDACRTMATNDNRSRVFRNSRVFGVEMNEHGVFAIFGTPIDNEGGFFTRSAKFTVMESEYYYELDAYDRDPNGMLYFDLLGRTRNSLTACSLEPC